MRVKKRTKVDIISYILSFILMIALMGISILSLGKYSMLSNHGIIHTCDRISYYEGISDEMKTQAHYMGIPYGITKSGVKGVFSPKHIRKDMIKVLEAQMNGKEWQINTEKIRNKITANVEKQQKHTISESEQESLNAYIELIEDMYIRKMVIPGAKYLVNASNSWTKIAMVGIPACILIAVLCIFFLISMRRYFYHGLRYVVYGVLGAGVTLLITFSAMISNGFIYKINISDVYMRKFYTFLWGHEMLMQAFAGIGLLLAGMILIYIIYRQKENMEI